jgi:hypothetical protein
VSAAAKSPASWRTGARSLGIAAACVAAGALSLLAARQTTYDPTAWLIWGREIVHGELDTTVGPSWKPLPVFVTAPAALLGDAAQQELWLVAARAGGLGAVVLAFVLARRLGGPVAGVISAVALLLAGGLASQVFRGDSEGMLAALALGAVLSHLAGHRWRTFALVVGTVLLRPETMLFVAGYGLWLVRRAPCEERRRTTAIVLGVAVLIVSLWLVPEEIGSGEPLRAASRARRPVADSPAQAAFPFLATFTNGAPILPWPIYVGGVALVVAALRKPSPDRLPLALAATATLLMVVVAVMAQGGFTGKTRYLTIPIAITCVLGGAGWAWLYRMTRSRLSARGTAAVAALAAAAAAPFVVRDVLRLRDETRYALAESALYAALPDAIARSGGRAALMRCGALYTAPADTQAVARALRVHEWQVGIAIRPPGAIVARRGSSLSNDRRFPTLVRTSRWVVSSTCSGR